MPALTYRPSAIGSCGLAEAAHGNRAESLVKFSLNVVNPSAAAGDVPAPIDAAAQEEVLVGSVRADPDYPGGYWIWAVLDNLVRGGALNAVEVAELVARS